MTSTVLCQGKDRCRCRHVALKWIGKRASDRHQYELNRDICYVVTLVTSVSLEVGIRPIHVLYFTSLVLFFWIDMTYI